MTSRATKAKRKAIPTFTLAELDKRDGVKRFDHLDGQLDRWLAAEQREPRQLEDEIDGKFEGIGRRF